MGDVYLAEDTKLGRKIALKVLPPELAESEERRARFKREAKALAALDHPNIVQVFSVEQANGVHFITLQLVRGKTLTELLPKKGFPLNKFFEIAIPMADAVAAAHQEGITHRDLKPDNMMVGDDGRVKVLDFGLAKPTRGFVGGDADSALPTEATTTGGVIVGTLNYMSPEQAEGTSVDARSDIFSMGVIFYQWLTGELPFQGNTPASALSAIIKDTAPSLTVVKPELPRDLGRIVRRCLHKDVTRRFQTALDVRNELAELLEALGTEETIAVPARRHWLGYLAAGLVGASLVAFPGYFVRSGDRANLPRLVNPIQVTSALGIEDSPSWSPDGQTLAYGANPAADFSSSATDWDIWILQVGSDHGLNRTSDFRDEFRYPVWSPDGRQLAAWSGREGGGYFVMPALAGPVRKIASFDPLDPHGPAPPQRSPDG